MQEVHGPIVIWVGSVWGFTYAMGYREMRCARRVMCQEETRMVQVHQSGHEHTLVS